MYFNVQYNILKFQAPESEIRSKLKVSGLCLLKCLH
uniref:Uncharacterized protein n=1 Tax=Arundo donax TaxID=35708 RepID=A0A0A9EQF5_ARUDO